AAADKDAAAEFRIEGEELVQRTQRQTVKASHPGQTAWSLGSDDIRAAIAIDVSSRHAHPAPEPGLEGKEGLQRRTGDAIEHADARLATLSFTGDNFGNAVAMHITGRYVNSPVETGIISVKGQRRRRDALHQVLAFKDLD